MPSCYTYGALRYGAVALDSSSVAPDGTLTVSVDVTNDGGVGARETVQLYVSAVGSRVMRSPLDLRAFGQVELAPMETRTVALSVAIHDLAFYDVAAGAWEVEAIEYTVGVGPNAADLPLSATFRVE